MATMTEVASGSQQSFRSVADTNQDVHQEEYISTFFVKALYDYDSEDPSALSFRRGDIIEVLTRLESGWWDGLLGEERGWFPSNYVRNVEPHELDATLSETEIAALNQPALADESVVDMAQALSGQSDSENEWLGGAASSHSGIEQLMRVDSQSSTVSNDFWVPKVTGDGQVFYVNTKTGESARDLPLEADSDISDSDLAGLAAQQRPRAGTTASFGLINSASDDSLDGSVTTPTAGFGVPRRAGTPEPWQRRLADDGMTYYWRNKSDGTVSWTRPEVSASTPTAPILPVNGKGYDPHLLTYRSDLGTNAEDMALATAGYSHGREGVFHTPGNLLPDANVPAPRVNGTDRASVYSDDSDIVPLEQRVRTTSTSSHEPITNGAVPSSHLQSKAGTIELTSAERSAKALQEALTPSLPETITELSAKAQDAIAVAVNATKTRSRGPDHDREMETRVHAVVLAVRNLLYVAALPSGHVPEVGPTGKLGEIRANAASHSIQAQLKPAQRKVTATLSKLVLSARAVYHDSLTTSVDNGSRIEADALELDKALAAFVLEVQRCQQRHSTLGFKRVLGAFSPSGLGLGLIGGGAAGTWKGYGWVALDDVDDMPSRILSPAITQDLGNHVQKLVERLSAFVPALRLGTLSPAEVVIESQDLVSGFASFLVFVADIHIARHVDIDGIHQDPERSPTYDLYMKSVNQGRSLVRTLEAAVQSLYDDSASLLLTAQSIRAMEFLEIRHNVKEYTQLEVLSDALKAHATLVHQTLEALLTVGHDQADLASGDYNGSIEWRMSRLSVIDSALRPASLGSVVDMELAFRQPAASKLSQMAQSSTSGSTLYRQDSQLSESSLDYSDQSPSANGDLPPTPTWESTEQSGSTVVGGESPEMAPRASLDEADDLDDDLAGVPKKAGRSKKLLWLVGEEAPTGVIQKLESATKPWYLRQTYDPAQIIIEPEGNVKGGTLAALVERLTAHENTDTKFNVTFMMTYKSFTTLDELFDKLVERFHLKAPEGLNPKEFEEWTKLKQQIVQTRVLNFFRSMLTVDDVLEKDDYYIMDRLKPFLVEEAQHVSAAKPLQLLVERAMSGDIGLKKTPVTLQPPPPILPKSSGKKLKLMDIDPIELARQLCILESQLYQKIRPLECLQRSREQKQGQTDNITSVIATANRIANWVADSILQKEDSRKRAAIVKQFINVADRCRSMHNFSSMVAIVSGLNTPHIRRLKRTWEQVNTRSMGQLGVCEALIDSNKNFNNYRKTLEKVTPPCVPFFGTYITTLTFIQDGNPDMLPGGLINFSKRQKAADVMSDIRRWQHTPYSFQPVPTILQYLEDSLGNYADDEQLRDFFWNLSLEREPREREDEKMARLLQESGFL
ncbi:ras GEF [Punctularia strigosozonata HHB-11173 SS5]|uniref:ras GEF n=1 Tax=Punctularia strigosozonata (strain HHB-11173) TaxID=741275 RepID=UPI0004417A65|nr:ras GEF [Punctularia strigosozonata HHB-11173 SS5]EIN12823.1 ras GEF [Punctularia strigosozonata HHB-11173 SS5]